MKRMFNLFKDILENMELIEIFLDEMSYDDFVNDKKKHITRL